MKKLLNGLLALVMTLSMFAGINVNATEATTGSITIDKAINGETYSVYKMLNIKSKSENKVSYEVVEEWKEFYTSKGFTLTKNNLISGGTFNEEMETIAKEALAYAKSHNISAVSTQTAANNKVEFTGLELGYYLVDTTVGTVCAINNVPGEEEELNVVIEEKNPTPSVEKTIVENNSDTNNVKIGDTVDYQIVISSIANKKKVKASDTMTTGLTLDQNSIKVKVGTAEVDTSKYSITKTTNKFEVTFVDSYIESLGKTDQIIITYSAVLNENAVIAGEGNKNTVTLTYGNAQTTSDETTTYTYEMTLKKVDSEHNELEGAKFELTYGGKKIDLVKTDYGYRFATEGENNTTKVIEAGTVKIYGLENGTYTLTEIDAPEGYNKLAEPVTFTISNGNRAEVLEVINTNGMVLPSTGSTGTKIFLAIGLTLAIGAYVVFITNKRMENYE